jgi:hypothetical protein
MKTTTITTTRTTTTITLTDGVRTETQIIEQEKRDHLTPEEEAAFSAMQKDADRFWRSLLSKLHG